MNKNERKAYALGLLMETSNPLVRVRLDTPGVNVPDGYDDGSGHINLQLGYSMARPMIGFACDDDGFEVGLSFRGCPQYVRVPWEAVVSVAGPEDGWYFPPAPSEVPPPLVEKVQGNVIHVNFKRGPRAREVTVNLREAMTRIRRLKSEILVQDPREDGLSDEEVLALADYLDDTATALREVVEVNDGVCDGLDIEEWLREKGWEVDDDS